MSQNVRKHTFRLERPMKLQIRLCICVVWSESSLGTFWIAKGALFLHVDNEDSDQAARMRRLIWVFAGFKSNGTFPHMASRMVHGFHQIFDNLFTQVFYFLVLAQTVSNVLTLKAPITTAADDNFFFFFIFQRKQVLTFHVNHLLGRRFT